MSDERFHELAHKALRKESTPSEDRELRALISEKPELKKQLEQMRVEVAAVREILPLLQGLKRPGNDVPRAPMRRLQTAIREVFAPSAESSHELHELLARLEAWVRSNVGRKSDQVMELIFLIRQSLSESDVEVEAADLLTRRLAMKQPATVFRASPNIGEEETRRREAEIEKRLRSLELRLAQAEQVALECRQEIGTLIEIVSQGQESRAERTRAGSQPKGN